MVCCCLACASGKRPVLAPNEHLQQMAPDAVQRDIDECLRGAAEAGAGAQKGRQIAGRTAVGAAAGAAAGTVAGAITGRPGLGAAAGAAGGGTGGFLRGLFRAGDLDAVQRQYIEECLRQKGYKPIGWR
jgi:hypothetical protein